MTHRPPSPSPNTLIGLFERAASSTKGIRFLDRSSGDGTWVSYRDLLSRARGVAGALQEQGFARGDRIALVLPTSPEFFEAFFGAAIAGLIPVPLYPPLRLGRLDEYHTRTAAMLIACRARCVLTDKRIGRLLGRAVSRVPDPIGLHEVASLESHPVTRVNISANDLAFIQFSSGTTMAPKPIRLSHRQVLANVETIHAAVETSYPESQEFEHVCVSWLPLYHDMGLIGAIFVALSHPAEIVLIPPEVFVTNPAAWLHAVSRWRGTSSPAPNFAYALCADRVQDDEIQGIDLSSWRVALNGAEPVTPHALRRFVDRFEPYGLRREALSPVYGLAEAALAVTFSSLDHPFRVTEFDREALLRDARAIVRTGGQPLVSCGPPLPGFALKIVDERGVERPERCIGSLHVRGPSVMQGYDGLARETARVLAEDWLDTGDTGFLHEGELYLYGRKKDVIVLRGRNYAPQDIEQAIDGLAAVRTGCSVAMGALAPDSSGERLVLLVERAHGCSVDEADLVADIRGCVAERTGLTLDEVRLLDPGTLPRTSSGKLRRAEACRQWMANELEAPKSVNVIRLAIEMLRSRFALIRSASRIEEE